MLELEDALEAVALVVGPSCLEVEDDGAVVDEEDLPRLVLAMVRVTSAGAAAATSFARFVTAEENGGNMVEISRKRPWR